MHINGWILIGLITWGIVAPFVVANSSTISGWLNRQRRKAEAAAKEEAEKLRN